MKIVIVDDDCLVTGALKTILEANEDVDVVATGLDGRDAVRLYGEHKPDVLLMDIRMKNMNGLEAATEILQEVPLCHSFYTIFFSFIPHSFLYKPASVTGREVVQDIFHNKRTKFRSFPLYTQVPTLLSDNAAPSD